MATVHAGMAMSLDGFVADRNGDTSRLSDPAALGGSEYMTALIQETGAVVMGRRSFAMAEDPDWFVGNYEFQVPIFVLTHQPPPVVPKQDEHLTCWAPGCGCSTTRIWRGSPSRRPVCRRSGRSPHSASWSSSSATNEGRRRRGPDLR